jgi:large subunit ribosomal protein L1
MARHGKTYRSVAEKIEKDIFDLTEAINFIKENPCAKFDESVEVSFRLGVDYKKSDQAVRGSVTLPHGTGKKIRVLVFAEGAAAEQAKEAGADFVGYLDVIEKIQGGWLDFDVAVATTDAMKEVRKLGKFLGPRGLMPNPRTGTVTDNVAEAIQQIMAGKVEFKMDRQGNVQVAFGKRSFETKQLVENGIAIIQAVLAARPPAAKGTYVKKCVVSSTMGPGLAINIRDLAS